VAGTDSAIVVEREFHAGPDELYRAWIDPERLRTWFQPVEGVEAEQVRLDPRPGGALEVGFKLPQGGRGRVDGRFRELGPSRLVLDLRSRFAADVPGAETLVTVTLQPRLGTTTLVLRQEGVPEKDRADFEHAWQHCLSRIAGVCQDSLDRFYARIDQQPRYRSRFGGLWPDLSNAQELIAGKESLGILGAEDAERFRRWVRDGYVVLEGAVAPELIERFRNEIDASWEKGDPRVRVEVNEGGQRTFPRLGPHHRERPHKVLDYHAVSATAREVQFAPAIRRFLGFLFERPPLAFQSLLFRWGTEQEMHQDSAYVVLRSPMELVGCWIALEDVQPGSGELQYYVGSHRIPEYLWLGRARSRPYEFDDLGQFLRHVCVESERLGCPLQRFRPRKGDALIWHADLVHGGSKRERQGVTRKSLVTHFCPVDVDPEWLGQIPSSPKLEHAPGCYYCHPLA